MPDASGEVVTVEITEERLRKIVQLKVANVPDWQICQAYGFDGEMLQQLAETEEYKEEFRKHFEGQITDTQITNEGWDGLEKDALVQLRRNLVAMNDPDFALKVAAVANKAQRRPIMRNNTPIEGGHGGTAIIYVQGNFVNRMQNMQINERDHNKYQDAQKQNDFIDPSKVENMLGLNRQKENPEQDVMDILTVGVKQALEE